MESTTASHADCAPLAIRKLVQPHRNPASGPKASRMKHVLAAGRRHGSAQFRAGECSEKRDHPGENPDSQNPGRRREVLRDQVGHQEYAAADHAADHNRERVDQAQRAR